MSKVEQIIKQIQEGTYIVQLESLAQRILDSGVLTAEEGNELDQ